MEPESIIIIIIIIIITIIIIIIIRGIQVQGLAEYPR